jgi:hypothetical protein
MGEQLYVISVGHCRRKHGHIVLCLAASFHVQMNDVEKTEWKLEEKTVENVRECMMSIKHLFG